MRCIAFILGLALFSPSSSNAAIVASHLFDSSVNLTGATSVGVGGEVVAFNGFASAGDGWGVYDFATGGPFALFDDSAVGSGGGTPFATDSLGIVDSSKTDSFFGLTDTVNGESPGGMIGTFNFDISSATGGLTSIDIDFSAMGDFEASTDVFTVAMSIDGGAFSDIFTATVDETASKDYTMELGGIITLDDPLSINGTEIGDEFTTLSAAVSGSGTDLALRVTAVINGSEPIGFDNIIVNGITAIPEPSAASFLCLGSLIGLVRRRRRC